ncbi:unnamed protein product, partial [Candidula unifasciata]
PGPKYLLPPTVGILNHDPTITRAPGYSFGSRYSYSYSHGPGPYYVDSGLTNTGKENRSGFTLHGRPKRSIWEAASSNSPGPVYAISNNITDRKPPAYSFGCPYKPSYKTEGPGPNAYIISSDLVRNHRAALIGCRNSDITSFSYDYAQTPGPAHYSNTTPNVLNGSPAFTMGHKLKAPTCKLITPGPNRYNPGLEWTNPRSPRFSMGIRHHEDILTLAEVSD